MQRDWLTARGIRIDRTADVAVGVQLGWALRSAILSGLVAPGERLPPARELAEDLGVNPNTVRTVMAGLERDGLVEARQGSGTFAALEPPQRPRLPQVVADAVGAGHAAGVAPRDLAAALYNTDDGPPRDAAADERVRVREDIAVLERLVADLVRGLAGLADVAGGSLADDRAAEKGAGTGPRLLSLDELKVERERLVRLLATAQAAHDERTRAGGHDAAPATASAKPAAAPSPATAPARGPRAAPPKIQPA